MTYFENVKLAGLALLAVKRGEEANWELARLTCESTFDQGEIGRGRPAPAEKCRMDVWCRDVRDVAGIPFSEGKGELYKRVWREIGAYHVERLPGFSESCDQVRGSTSYERYERLAADNVVGRASAETKIETFKRLSEDPEVRGDKQAQSAALEFGVQVYRQREQDVREHWRADETAERQEERLEAIDTALALERAITGLEALFDRSAAPLLEKNRPTGTAFVGLTSALERLEARLDRVRYWMAHGEDEVDAFARSVLRGE